MADLYNYVADTGVILPDTSELQTAVQDEFRAALGADLVVTADTPQGALIVAETLARDAVVRNNASLANQINPNLAGGVFLDAIWSLTGGARLRATPSLVTGVTLTGTPGATVPAGSQARVGTDGPIFVLTSAVPLNNLGVGVGVFQSLELGPIAAPVGTLNRIVTAVLGWETVTNPAAASLGVAEETDQAARLRRRQTLSLQNIALPEAIISDLYTVTGVRSVLFRENYTAANLVIEGVTLIPHSVLVVVSGGTDADVARSLLANKSVGAAWNGTTTVAVVDPISGQSYDVKFRRPTPLPIYMRITVRQGSFIGAPAPAVRAAILAYAAGLVDGEEGFAVGADVSPFEIAGAVTAAAPGLFVSLVEIGTSPGALSAASITTTIVQQATVITGDIEVVIT